MVSKQQIIAEKILRRIFVHNQDYGGIFSEITGAQGSGKTSVLLCFADYVSKNYPKEKMFWRSSYNSPLQFFKIGDPNKYQIFVKKGTNVVFRDRDNHLEHIDLHPIYFTSFDDLWNKASSGKISAVFFGDTYEWLEFIAWLRGVGEWVNIYIDELGDVAPSNTQGELWQRLREFSNVLKDVRRCMMHVHVNTQSVVDVDYRIRGKVMLKIFLPGAIVDKNTRVTQRAVDNLDRDAKHGNQSYMDLHGEFGLARFTSIYKPIPGTHIEAHILQGVKGEKENIKEKEKVEFLASLYEEEEDILDEIKNKDDDLIQIEEEINVGL